jgi:hypothetical protein
MDAVNRLISIAAILALLIAGASTAWLNRDRFGFSGRNDGPDGPTQLAAITLPSGQTVQIAYEVPTKEDCTVEPLTVDQVMDKLRVIEPSLPLARAMSGTPTDSQAEMNAVIPNAAQLDEKTFTAIKDTQVEWLACALFGSPFQRWALESNTLVQQEFQAAYFPVFDMDAIEADLKALEAGKDINRFHAPVVSANGYLPMVLDSWQGFIDPRDNSANLFVLWMRADGQVLQPFWTSADPSASEPYRRASYFEQNLPNVWTFRPGDTADTWLLDSFTIKLG